MPHGIAGPVGNDMARTSSSDRGTGFFHVVRSDGLRIPAIWSCRDLSNVGMRLGDIWHWVPTAMTWHLRVVVGQSDATTW